MPIAKGISDMLDLGLKPSQVFSVVFLTSKLAKIAKDKCSHCTMALDYYFRPLSTAPSNGIVALWVHPFSLVIKTMHRTVGTVETIMANYELRCD